jgi:hypothetical protein
VNKYVIGLLLDPKSDDAVYRTYEEALRWAREWASQDRKAVIAIWERGDSGQWVHRVLVACEELAPYPFVSAQ